MSLNTSVVAILPILSVLVIGVWLMGATTLRDFGLALLIGLLTGAYSSIFIASPVLAVLKQREPRYRAVARADEQSQSASVLTPSAAQPPVRPQVSRPRPASPRKSQTRRKKRKRQR